MERGSCGGAKTRPAIPAGENVMRRERHDGWWTKGEESGECTGGDHYLRLKVIASDNVADGPKRRRLDRRRRVHEEVNQTPADTGFNDSLNLIVRTVREVRNCPARVDEDLVVERVDQFGQNGESRRDLEKVCL